MSSTRVQAEVLVDNSYKNMGGERIYTEIAPALTARDYKEPRSIVEKWQK